MFKKSSIAIAAALVLSTTFPVSSQQQSEPRSAAIELRETAPDRYVVQRGDTLWSIASKFLKEPWRWPEFWRFNHEQIRNPHAIYPGQALVLDRAGMRLAASPDGRMTPRVRNEPLPSDAIPSIPSAVIEPWLSRPLIVEPGQLDSAPQIVANEEGRYHLGAGGRAYVTGLPADTKEQQWQIYRAGRPLFDPDTKVVLAYEAVFVGSAKLVKNGNPATLQIQAAQIEVAVGDRLIPEERARLVNYMPQAPKTDVQARVLSIYGGRGDSNYLGAAYGDNRVDVADYDSRREAGPLQIVSINKGTRDGIDIGHVLALHRGANLKFDRSVGRYYMGGVKPADVQLPEERFGLVFVFRTFDKVSYGLIVQAERTVSPGDHARTP